jgi:hypothetical protein
VADLVDRHPDLVGQVEPAGGGLRHLEEQAGGEETLVQETPESDLWDALEVGDGGHRLG